MQTASAARLTIRGAKTRFRIVATAADLMRVRGIGGTTLDDVVLASKVSKSQLYRHFEDKPALVRAVIEFVGEKKIDVERERLGNVRTFAGLRRWKDAIVENNALQGAGTGAHWVRSRTRSPIRTPSRAVSSRTCSRRGKNSSKISFAGSSGTVSSLRAPTLLDLQPDSSRPSKADTCWRRPPETSRRWLRPSTCR